MKSETPLHRYRREAAECELNAEKSTSAVDRLAWQCLAEDWMKLVRGAEVNPRLSALERHARQLTKSNLDYQMGAATARLQRIAVACQPNLRRRNIIRKHRPANERQTPSDPACRLYRQQIVL
jgi:hypothetical protein